MNTQFGLRLKEFRKSTGKNQVEFAETIGHGTSQANVSSWERGSFPDGQNLELIFRTFPTLNKDWLVSGKGPMLTTPLNNSQKELTPSPRELQLEVENSRLKDELIQALKKLNGL